MYQSCYGFTWLCVCVCVFYSVCAGWGVGGGGCVLLAYLYIQAEV